MFLHEGLEGIGEPHFLQLVVDKVFIMLKKLISVGFALGSTLKLRGLVFLCFVILFIPMVKTLDRYETSMMKKGSHNIQKIGAKDALINNVSPHGVYSWYIFDDDEPKDIMMTVENLSTNRFLLMYYNASSNSTDIVYDDDYGFYELICGEFDGMGSRDIALYSSRLFVLNMTHYKYYGTIDFIQNFTLSKDPMAYYTVNVGGDDIDDIIVFYSDGSFDIINMTSFSTTSFSCPEPTPYVLWVDTFDYNRDGSEDIIIVWGDVAEPSGLKSMSMIEIVFGNNLTEHIVAILSFKYYYVVAGNFDKDSALELVYTNSSTTMLYDVVQREVIDVFSIGGEKIVLLNSSIDKIIIFDESGSWIYYLDPYLDTWYRFDGMYQDAAFLHRNITLIMATSLTKVVLITPDFTAYTTIPSEYFLHASVPTDINGDELDDILLVTEGPSGIIIERKELAYTPPSIISVDYNPDIPTEHDRIEFDVIVRKHKAEIYQTYVTIGDIKVVLGIAQTYENIVEFYGETNPIRHGKYNISVYTVDVFGNINATYWGEVTIRGYEFISMDIPSIGTTIYTHFIDGYDGAIAIITNGSCYYGHSNYVKFVDENLTVVDTYYIGNWTFVDVADIDGDDTDELVLEQLLYWPTPYVASVSFGYLDDDGSIVLISDNILEKDPYEYHNTNCFINDKIIGLANLTKLLIYENAQHTVTVDFGSENISYVDYFNGSVLIVLENHSIYRYYIEMDTIKYLGLESLNMSYAFFLNGDLYVLCNSSCVGIFNATDMKFNVLLKNISFYIDCVEIWDLNNSRLTAFSYVYGDSVYVGIIYWNACFVKLEGHDIPSCLLDFDDDNSLELVLIASPYETIKIFDLNSTRVDVELSLTLEIESSSPDGRCLYGLKNEFFIVSMEGFSMTRISIIGM